MARFLKDLGRGRRQRRWVPGRRSGYTLIEVLFYVSLIGLISGSFVAVLRGTYQASQETAGLVLRGAQWHRFARDWVDDVHSARGAEIVREGRRGVRLVLQKDEEVEVVYQGAQDRMERVERRAGEVTHRETYSFGEPVDVQWQTDESLPFLEATAWRGTTGGDERVLFRHVTARLATDWRYAGETP
jgi:hypothetical protein